ncbi:MAG: sulfotransferase [Pseudomonadota bacterium]
MDEGKDPNFFILGAPKTASTSLYDLFSKHPQIHCPSVKEPGYFTRHEVKSETIAETPHLQSYDLYRSLYASATADHVVRCDGSTSYLRHPDALREILELYPDAVFVALYRDPVELISSYHGYLVHEGWEDLPTLESAWDVQDMRRAGECIPAAARRTSSVVYADVAKLGAQIETAREILGDRLHIYSMMEVRANTDAVMRDLQRILGLTHYDLGALPSLNFARTARNETLNALIKNPPSWVKSAKKVVKKTLGVSSLGVRAKLEGVNSVRKTRKISDEMTTTLRKYYRSDVARLSKIVGRDLENDWGW